MNDKAIGIFDSGLGGLTVLKEIHRLLPNENLIYFGDSKRAPYGTKSREAIINFAFQDIRFLISKNIKAIVVACNTVSSNAIDEINEEFNIPIIEVITPGARAGVEATQNGKIGVIGTVATIESGAYEKALLKEQNGIEIFVKSCPLFVPIVEEGRDMWDGPIAELAAHRYLDEFLEMGIDTLILGCTHYPLLKNVIQRVVGEGVFLIDSAEKVSLRLMKTLENKITKRKEKGIFSIYTSDSIDKFMPICKEILGESNIKTSHIDIENY